jgi:hypothetical protein
MVLFYLEISLKWHDTKKIKARNGMKTMKFADEFRKQFVAAKHVAS